MDASTAYLGLISDQSFYALYAVPTNVAKPEFTEAPWLGFEYKFCGPAFWLILGLRSCESIDVCTVFGN
jgi:hypothetical protein